MLITLLRFFGAAETLVFDRGRKSTNKKDRFESLGIGQQQQQQQQSESHLTDACQMQPPRVIEAGKRIGVPNSQNHKDCIVIKMDKRPVPLISCRP